MDFLLAGGDDRQLYLAQMLIDAGHTVRCYALENALLPDGARHTDKPDADCIILPLPVEGKPGLLNAPYSAKQHPITELLSAIAPGSLVCGGKLSPLLCDEARSKSLRIYDYMTMPQFVVGNAAVTAEGAVSLLADNNLSTIFDTKILIVGFGRIGRLLAHKLRGLDAETYVMSKNSESRALAGCMGLHAVSPADRSVFSAFDAVINTAPAQVIPTLEGFRKSCLLLELASAPGGFDRSEVERRGLKCIHAAGLPGRYAPKSAARLVFDAVQQILREEAK